MMKQVGEAKTKPDYMAAWVQHGNTLWGTVSALLVFLGLVLNVLAAEKLSVTASIAVCCAAALALLVYRKTVLNLRLNMTALEFYMRSEEDGHEWPAEPSAGEMTAWSVPQAELPRFIGGWFRGRLARGREVTGRDLRGLNLSVSIVAALFLVVAAFCIWWAIHTHGWHRPPPWVLPTER